MAELISQDNHVLPDDIRLAILDSRLIPGRIENEHLEISIKTAELLLKVLFNAFINLKIEEEIYFIPFDSFIEIKFEKPKASIYYYSNFEVLFSTLFIKANSNSIGLRRSIIISNLLLKDDYCNLCSNLKIDKQSLGKFIDGNCDMRDSITINKLRKLYRYDQSIENGVLILHHIGGKNEK